MLTTMSLGTLARCLFFFLFTVILVASFAEETLAAPTLHDLNFVVTDPQPTEPSNASVLNSCYQMRNSWFPCAVTIPGNIFLMIFYGAILIMAAKLISDGAELLLDLGLPASIIGGLVLPLLGAVPDAVMILVSGLGPRHLAQKKITVGMGALAGSTIMLLTLAWSISLIVGRCNLDEEGKAIEGTGGGQFNLKKQGITVLPEVKAGVIIMLLTSLSYFIVQGADWHFGPTKVGPQPAYIRDCALATMIFSIVAGLFNLIYLVWDSKAAERRQQRRHEEMLKRKVAQKFILNMTSKLTAQSSVAGFSRTEAANNDTTEDLADDKTKLLVSDAISKKYLTAWKVMSKPNGEERKESEETSDKPDSAEGEETNEVATPEERKLIARKAILMLAFGLFLVIFFSDPMCNAVVALTNKYNENFIPISAFYVSFVVNPVCSNASELVSSLQFAAKRKKLNATVTYSQLYGAAIMNNTLCLAVFTGLVYFRNLEWESSAEVLVILLVIWCVGAIGYRETYQVWMFIPVAFLYFFSIFLVAILKSPLVGWK